MVMGKASMRSAKAMQSDVSKSPPARIAANAAPRASLVYPHPHVDNGRRGHPTCKPEHRPSSHFATVRDSESNSNVPAFHHSQALNV